MEKCSKKQEIPFHFDTSISKFYYYEGGRIIIGKPHEGASKTSPLAPIWLGDIPHKTGRLTDVENPCIVYGKGAPKTSPLTPICPVDIPHQIAQLTDVEDPPVVYGAGVDIIKAIVYGGLLESITSLSVIASAAGGDTSTLNIVVVGLANVFGGLVLLFRNLRTLKQELGAEQYTQQLGRPGHFLLHATIAVISYLFFGLMAPIIYGFSFEKSDNKDYKIATLAAASFVSITALSTANSYVQSPPKAYIQTIFYYLSLGFMVSGLGYVAGDLITILLKKLDVFDSRSVVPHGGDVNGLWASF